VHTGIGVGKPEEKRPLGIPGRRWKALVNAVMNLQVPQNVGNFLTSSGPVSFSMTPLHEVSWSSLMMLSIFQTV
jgi:hypothetical protein